MNIGTLLKMPSVLLALASLGGLARGADDVPITRKISFEQKLGAQLPLAATFRDEEGRPIRLGDCFQGRPAIVNLVYYECPMICNEVLNDLGRSLKVLSLEPGRDYQVITVSIDPRESPKLASAKKRRYIKRLNRAGAENAWHFLTGTKPEIDRLAQAIGFRYTFDERTKLYAHAAGLVLATPDGKVARYFYGISFPSRDLKFGLMEAARGKIGRPIDQAMLFCYAYDEATGRYNLAIIRILRVLGLLTAGTLATYMLVMFRRDRRAAARPPAPVSQA
jgi:protein SCO1/2